MMTRHKSHNIDEYLVAYSPTLLLPAAYQSCYPPTVTYLGNYSGSFWHFSS